MQELSANLNQVQSQAWFDRAQQCIPGGVNSPVRAYNAVGGIPPFIQEAQGAYVTDVDGNRYIDYVGSWGPMILGHNHPKVLEAVQEACEQGLSFGAPCPAEVELAEEICRRYASIEKVRMVNSGTEATMSAIRLARGYTGRSKIIKFEGCYHGHSDHLLVKAGSGALTLGIPSSPGVPEGTTADTLTATFNNLDSVAALFEKWGSDIAAIIVEPIAGNMNMVLPIAGFLEGLRLLCNHYQSVLIFDEVITGFRVSPSGAQGLYNVKPDLTVLGKIIGGGMPVGAFGGQADIMEHLAPCGPVYQAGTLSGNPVAMAAGLATLEQLRPERYAELAQQTGRLVEGILARAQAAGIAMSAHYRCGLFGLFFTDEPNVVYYDQVMACNRERFSRFFWALLIDKVYLGPSAFESGFISLSHGDEEIGKTLKVVEKTLASLT